MKRVIYGTILNAARLSGGALQAPTVGSGAKPQRKSNLIILA